MWFRALYIFARLFWRDCEALVEQLPMFRRIYSGNKYAKRGIRSYRSKSDKFPRWRYICTRTCTYFINIVPADGLAPLNVRTFYYKIPTNHLRKLTRIYRLTNQIITRIVAWNTSAMYTLPINVTNWYIYIWIYTYICIYIHMYVFEYDIDNLMKLPCTCST